MLPKGPYVSLKSGRALPIRGARLATAGGSMIDQTDHASSHGAPRANRLLVGAAGIAMPQTASLPVFRRPLDTRHSDPDDLTIRPAFNMSRLRRFQNRTWSRAVQTGLPMARPALAVHVIRSRGAGHIDRS